MKFQKYLDTIVEAKSDKSLDISADMKSIIKKIASKTDVNDHTEARIMIAEKILKDEELTKMLKDLLNIQDYFGHSPAGLIELRDALTHIVKEKVISKFGDLLWDEINSAL